MTFISGTKRFLRATARSIVPKKKSPKFHEKPHVQGNRPQKKVKRKAISFQDRKPDKGWIVAGFDTSMSSITGAAIAYDGILKQFKGPVFTVVRWSKEDHYFDRIKAAAKAHDFMLDLQAQLLLSIPLDKIFIAQEEPWPMGRNITGGGGS